MGFLQVFIPTVQLTCSASGEDMDGNTKRYQERDDKEKLQEAQRKTEDESKG